MNATTDPAASPGARTVRAGTTDLDTLSHVIASAFHDLPQSKWLIPDPEARRRVFPAYFRLHVEHALKYGTVHTTADRAAAALWLPGGGATASPPTDYAARLSAITGSWADRFVAFDATLDEHHPADIAHHWLAILAVRPGRQGSGIGSMLLQAYHDRLDTLGIPAYLEAAAPRSLSLYLRHGYALRPNSPFHLPDGGPPMWPMLRIPRQH